MIDKDWVRLALVCLAVVYLGVAFIRWGDNEYRIKVLVDGFGEEYLAQRRWLGIWWGSYWWAPAGAWTRSEDHALRMIDENKANRKASRKRRRRIIEIPD